MVNNNSKFSVGRIFIIFLSIVVCLLVLFLIYYAFFVFWGSKTVEVDVFSNQSATLLQQQLNKAIGTNFQEVNSSDFPCLQDLSPCPASMLFNQAPNYLQAEKIKRQASRILNQEQVNFSIKVDLPTYQDFIIERVLSIQ